MPRILSSNRAQELLESLRYAVHGLEAPFACDGTFVPERPVTLRFKDNAEFPIVRGEQIHLAEQALEPLVRRCSQAAFGHGRKTKYNRAIRDALQLNATDGAFSALNFDPAEAGILEQIRRELTPHFTGELTAELYNLNVYPRDGHFVAHKDTPRGADMLGTLVVCLPSYFSNGAFVVKHRGVFLSYDWGEAIRLQTEPERVHWAAFFGDCDHSIDRVWSGYRVTLTYLIRRGADAGPADHPAAKPKSKGLVQAKFHELLNDRRFLPKGGTLAFPCSHLYHQDARLPTEPRPLGPKTVSVLKGRDHGVAAAAMAEGLDVSLVPYMVETCMDATWQLDHFPTKREQAMLDSRVTPWDLEETLAVRAQKDDPGEFNVIWVDPPPRFNRQPRMYPGIDEAAPRDWEDGDAPGLWHLHECEMSFTGYFGNEGGGTDFYVYGALQVKIPPFGIGARAGTGEQSVEPKPRTAKPRTRSKRAVR